MFYLLNLLLKSRFFYFISPYHNSFLKLLVLKKGIQQKLYVHLFDKGLIVQWIEYEFPKL